ncbi:MAG TPA: TerB family tellurite resistance protein [Polyangiaceae bacterium]|jgi:tellurite resistance protein|nr:TerB family tellurite resistance protein [Polyangiaceae bacterium]
MTPGEKNIVKSLVAVAWADGKVEAPEANVIEGLLAGFDATPAEEQEILDYAKSKRTFANDIPVAELSLEDKELLLANAALLTHADGDQSPEEKALLTRLSATLGFSAEQAQAILDSAGDGALQLSPRSLRGAEE